MDAINCNWRPYAEIRPCVFPWALVWPWGMSIWVWNEWEHAWCSRILFIWIDFSCLLLLGFLLDLVLSGILAPYCLLQCKQAPIPVRELCLQKYRGTIFVKPPRVTYLIPTHNSFFRGENGGFSCTVRRNWLKCGGRSMRTWRICSKEAASIKDSERKIIIENWSVVKRGMFPTATAAGPQILCFFPCIFLWGKKARSF